MEDSGTLVSLFGDRLDKLAQIERQLKDLEKQANELKQERDALTEELVKDMDEADVTRITFAGKTFFRRSDKYPRITDEDSLFESLRSIGRGDMIKAKVNSQSLRSLCRELGENNEPIPDGCELFIKERIGIRG